MNTASIPAERSNLLAVIPAAGISRRMGECKALLDVGGMSLIRLAIDRLSRAGVADVFVTVRADDVALREELSGIPLVTAVVAGKPPPEMLASIRLATREIGTRLQPPDNCGVFILPSDHPCCAPPTLEVLTNVFSQSGRASVIRPGYKGKSGHPILLPWMICRNLDRIPAGHGLNWLLKQRDLSVIDIEVDDPETVTDLNTRELFQRWLTTRDSHTTKDSSS